MSNCHMGWLMKSFRIRLPFHVNAISANLPQSNTFQCNHLHVTNVVVSFLRQEKNGNKINTTNGDKPNSKDTCKLGKHAQ